jgi:hypothetical protein
MSLKNWMMGCIGLVDLNLSSGGMAARETQSKAREALRPGAL